MAKKTPKKPPARAARTPAAPAAAKKRAAAPAATAQPTARKIDKSSRPRDSKPLKLKRRRPERVPSNNLPPLPPVIIPRRVTTDGKPRKNQAGLSMKDLEHFRELLLQKRRELVGDMSSMEREALRSTTGTNLSNLPIHMADMGTDNYEQEFTLGLVEKDRQLLREINRALAKIMDGTYGICEGTGKPITRARLEAQPWAKYSIDYARQLERGMLRR